MRAARAGAKALGLNPPGTPIHCEDEDARRQSDPVVPPMTVANRVAAGLFAVCAAVQVNDADWAVWFAVYATAFGLCIAWERGLLRRDVAGAVATAALVCAAWSAWVASSAGALAPDLHQWGMTDRQSERVREAGGLLLVGLWAAALARASPVKPSTGR